MKLTDLDPMWIDATSAAPNRRGLGVLFQKPPGQPGDHYIAVLFANPLDGGPPAPECEDYPKPRWTRTGDTFETLSISPSIFCSPPTGWHGWVTNGEVA